MDNYKFRSATWN